MSRGKAKTVEQLKQEAELKIKTAEAKAAFKSFMASPNETTLEVLARAAEAVAEQDNRVSQS